MELIPFMFVFVLAFAVVTIVVMAVDDCCHNRNLIYVIAGFGYGCLTIALIAGFLLIVYIRLKKDFYANHKSLF